MYKAKTLSDFTIPAWIPQIIRFSLVGILNTLLDAGIYLVLTRWLGFGALPVLAKGIAYTIGMGNSFIWNRNWTFNSEARIGRAAGIFVLAQVAALGVNAGVMAWGLNLLHLPEWIALGLATLAVFSWNFAINKWLVFRS